MTLLRSRHPARHRSGCGATQPSARRQNRNHQRIHRRLVPGLLALHHLRRLGRLRHQSVPGRKGNWSPRGPAHLDNLDARCHQRQRQRKIPRRRTGKSLTQDSRAAARQIQRSRLALHPREGQRVSLFASVRQSAVIIRRCQSGSRFACGQFARQSSHILQIDCPGIQTARASRRKTGREASRQRYSNRIENQTGINPTDRYRKARRIRQTGDRSGGFFRYPPHDKRAGTCSSTRADCSHRPDC